MKSRIVEHLGHSDILLPSLVGEALAANDRIKVRLSALQAAAKHASNPVADGPDLTVECRMVGIEPVGIHLMMSGARIAVDGRINAPNLSTLREGMLTDMAAMLRAVELGAPAEGKAAAQRLSVINAQGLFAPSNDMSPAQINQLAGISEAGGDSLHRLVMDLHKVLNRLVADCSEEDIAGAQTYGLGADDRPAVEAFMRGVNSTAGLKFDHPGLAATATRVGPRLTIQNDIGATDAHVIVIAVENSSVIITYTAVHRARARFFTRLTSEFAVQWTGLERTQAKGLGEDNAFYLVVGRFESDARERRNEFLTALGASLVFLIDWNKARKALRAWLPTDDVVRVLDWAARKRLGHRAFLELGGNEFVQSAVRNAAANRIGFGERLDSVLGREAAIDFLKSVLRISTEALVEGRSVRFARDRVEAELAGRLKGVERTLFAIVVRQAGLAREIVAAIGHHIAAKRSGEASDGAGLAARARRLEEKADLIALDARKEIARLGAGPAIERLVNCVEDVIDELEQAAFIASLIPPDPAAGVLAPLAELCAAALAGTQAAVSGADAAAEVPEGRRANSEDALAAVGRLTDIEHAADDAERRVTSEVLRAGLDLANSLTALESCACPRTRHRPIGELWAPPSRARPC